MSVQVFDDTAPEFLYIGTWFLGGSPNEFNSTAHGTSEPGARIIFSFTGTSVQVRGSVELGLGAPAPISTYVLDNGSPVTFFGTPTSTAQFNQVFFQSQVPNGTHSLYITSTVSGGTFWIDSITVTPPNAVNAANQTFLSPTSSTGLSPSHPLSPGVIFGIAIGSSLLLGSVLAILVYFYCSRQRRRRHSTDHESKLASALSPKRKTERITAFVSQSTKQIPVVPPAKADLPPASTNRYDYSVKLSTLQRAATKRGRERGDPPLTDLPDRRRRPSNAIGQPGKSPPKKNMLVINNL
ncbi:hypothetical protein C8R43DRAFT_205286 [Mycena crocata]|nr:hypothetical protein C8R43DRAFT_205286 [Mycena crocata]